MDRNEINTYRYLPNSESGRLKYLEKLQVTVDRLDQQGRHRTADALVFAVEQAFQGNEDYLIAHSLMKFMPVTIDEFLDNDFYLGGRVDVWPKLREELNAIIPDLLLGGKPVLEVLNASAIGTGKSELAKVSMLYWIYYLTCFNTPQYLFRSLNKYTNIVFTTHSVNESVNKRVLYEPLRQMFLDMPYVKKYVVWDKDKESSLVLSDRITLAPMLADPSKFIGQATIGSIIDEANFMLVVSESKRVVGPAGKGGLLDQAERTYRALSRRRKSRFITQGVNPGLIYVSSSVNYQEDFLERRINEIDPQKDTHVRVLKYKQYDVKPEGTFSGQTFQYLVGTNDYAGRVLKPEDFDSGSVPKDAVIEVVPSEFEEDFRHDPDNSQRDILGYPSGALDRFIKQPQKIIEAIARCEEFNNTSFLVKDNVELSIDGMLQVNDALLPEDLDCERFIHIDLSRVSDKCGIAMVKVPKYVSVKKHNVTETLPYYVVEMAATIQPDPVNQIDLPEIRQFVLLLKNFYGFNIKSVTYDGFDSMESQQLLRKAGVPSYEISMDKTDEPYQQFKDALYSDRICLVNNPLLKNELANLEQIIKGGKLKVDHPPRGSKDISDAVVGACKAASMYRSVRRNIEVLTEQNESKEPQPRRNITRRKSIRGQS